MMVSAGGEEAVQKFRRYEIRDLNSVSAIFPPDKRRGIYVLEFANGEQYVGQAVNVVDRFTSHRHNSAHHAPWVDVVAIQFLTVKSAPLSPIELDHIRYLRGQGIKLRNKAGNVGHTQPSRLDTHISVEDQEHWVLGLGGFGDRAFAPLAAPGETKLTRNIGKKDPMLRRRILEDIRYALTELIPDAPDLERRYWTLSDYPSTAGGRFATLNTGVLEFVVFPRSATHYDGDNLDYSFFINLPEGTWVSDDYWVPFSEHYLDGCALESVCWTNSYDLCSTSALCLPVGTLGTAMELIPDLKSAARGMAVELMRQNTANLFTRWHSPALVREAMAMKDTRRGSGS